MVSLRGVVEIGCDRIASAGGRGSAAGTSSAADSQRGLAVFFFDDFLDVDVGGGGGFGAHALGGHGVLLFADLNNVFELHDLVAGAALGVEELE